MVSSVTPTSNVVRRQNNEPLDKTAGRWSKECKKFESRSAYSMQTLCYVLLFVCT